MEGFIVAALMQQLPFGGPEIFGPLLFQIGEGPLPPAERKVLDAGHLQIFVRMRHTLPPQGRAARRR